MNSSICCHASLYVYDLRLFWFLTLVSELIIWKLLTVLTLSFSSVAIWGHQNSVYSLQA